MKDIEKLVEMRAFAGPCQTHGLSQEIISRFLDQEDLCHAIDSAYQRFLELKNQRLYAQLLQSEEAEQIKTLQQDYVNFYLTDAINPYLLSLRKGLGL